MDRWALGELGAKLTWAVLEERFGFSRQSLQAKSEIKAAYDNAKQALSGGLVKTKAQATKEAEELQVEVDRLKAELEAYKRKEAQWLRRWQQIAFHVRQKGIQMASVDQTPPKGGDLPSNTEVARILRPFDKKMPPSGRT
nr:protein kinase [Providencia rettgeri]